MDAELCVKDMIRGGNWEWPQEWYSKFSNVTSIQEPRLINDKDDWVVWKSINGLEMKIAVKNVFQELRYNDPIVPW